MTTAAYRGNNKSIEDIATMVRTCFRDKKRRTLFLYTDQGDRDGFLIIMHSGLSDGVYIRSESRNDHSMTGQSTLYPEIDRKGIISVVRSWL